MEITEVKVYPSKEEGKLKAYATVVFDDCFAVRDLKVIDGIKGYFVSMPSRRRKDGTYKDVAHPTNPEMRGVIEHKVIEEYNRILTHGENLGYEI